MKEKHAKMTPYVKSGYDKNLGCIAINCEWTINILSPSLNELNVRKWRVETDLYTARGEHGTHLDGFFGVTRGSHTDLEALALEVLIQNDPCIRLKNRKATEY